MELNKRDNWLSTLVKGEAMGLLEECDGIDNNGKPAKIVKINFQMITLIIQRAHGLCKRCIQFFIKNLRFILKKKGSGLIGKVAMGSIAAMTEENAG